VIRKAIHIALSTALFIFCYESQAQINIPVLSWQTHFSYNNINSITSGDNKIFAAANHGIFYVDQTDNSTWLINKNNGLSDVDIAAIHYNEILNKLVIGYKDGGIDFWERANVESLSTVKDAEITGSKTYRNIQSFGNRIYLSGDLGIIVYDTENSRITESYLNLGQAGERLSINEIYIESDSVYAMSDDGILSASNSSNVNLQDFNNWQRSLTGLSFTNIEEFENQLYASSGQDIFIYANSEWTYFSNTAEEIEDLEVTNGRLTALAGNQLYQRFGNSLAPNKTITSSNTMLDFNGYLWVGSQNLGLSRYIYIREGFQSFKPNGPVSDNNLKSFWENGNAFFMYEDGFSKLSIENRSWTTDNTAVIQSRQLTDLDFKVRLPSDLDLPVMADFNLGLFVTNEANDLIFNSSGSTLNRINNSYAITAIEGEDEHMWILSRNFGSPLHRWNVTRDNWTEYDLDQERTNFATDLFISNEGDKWITIEESQGGGIVVFNESSGRERYLNINGGQGGLPGRKVNDLVYDQDEFLWIATNGGIGYYPNPEDVLNGQPLTAEIPIFENRLLLRDEHITAISIDPANRKWIGTLNNGLWLFSETGEELIFHFTVDNSPLPSNEIVDLVINPNSGELFITTASGLVSFRGDATEGLPSHTNVKIYPNPVAPNFQGNIVLEGLVNNATVKITDVSGKLVREVRANGSTAIWNIRDLSNSRVATGVYLVFSSNRDGTETYVGKIVVI